MFYLYLELVITIFSDIFQIAFLESVPFMVFQVSFLHKDKKSWMWCLSNCHKKACSSFTAQTCNLSHSKSLYSPYRSSYVACIHCSKVVLSIYCNQSSGRPVRSESLNLLRIHLNQWKYYFWFNSQLTGLIQNKTKYCNINLYTHTTSGTIFSANVLLSGSQVIFQYEPGAYL